MTRFGILLAALALLPIGAAVAAESAGSATIGSPSFTAMRVPVDGWPVAGWPVDGWPVAGWRPPMLHQVRIEQHFSIRITPGTAAVPPSVVEEIEEEERIEPVQEHKTGKCLMISSIATLRPADGSELLLFLHDDRIIAAKLEKRCAARDFYAGFYIESHADGAICAGRDTLQSRSGANCKLRRLHELVRTNFRRFP